MKYQHPLLSGCIAAACLLSSATASAETTLCTEITSAPYVISSPGIYCLTADLVSNDPNSTFHAIEVNANNVVIDLNGHKIGGLGAGPGTLATGIYAAYRQNITIRNGTIRGFYWAIFFNDSASPSISQGHLIEDMRLDQNTATGIYLTAKSSVIRRNQIVATGGGSYSGWVSGIKICGQNNRVIDNDVTDTRSATGSWAFGINLEAYVDNSVVSDNRVTGLVAGAGGQSAAIYVWGTNGIVRNNQITTASGTYGLYLYQSVVYSNNIVLGFTAPIIGSTPATNYLF